MIQKFNDINIHFSIADTHFQTLNLISEEFQRTIPTHVHGSGNYEIHYISKGHGKALINGEPYRITPNTLYITGPQVEHAQSPQPEDPMLEYCVYLKITKRRRPDTAASETEREILKCFETTAFWFGQDSQHAGETMLELFREITEQKKGWQIQAEALLKKLLICLIRNYEKGNKGNADTVSGNSDRTSIIIEDYFLYHYQNLSLEELAGKLGLSPRQTERLLQKQYGKTFLQKKTEAKMSPQLPCFPRPLRALPPSRKLLGILLLNIFPLLLKNTISTAPGSIAGTSLQLHSDISILPLFSHASPSWH